MSSFAAASVVFAAAAGNSAAAPVDTATETKRPNILVIMTDDQRANGTFSVMPRTQRWFGAGGTTFIQAYATTPLCCPSRASFFSGRYAHNHGVIRSTDGQADNLDQRTTLQRYLSEDGYSNAIFGKYLNHWDLDQDPPHFDEWAIFEGGKALGYYDGTWNVDGRRKKVSTYSTTYVRRRALRFLETAEINDERPWLMFVHPYAPHLPFSVPDRYKNVDVGPWQPNPAVFEEDLSDKPPFSPRLEGSIRRGARLRRKQLRSLIPVDRLVGRLMSTLQELDEDSDTLAFYTSDNGYNWGEHQLIKKSTPYNASVQIPLMARWPQRLPGGVLDDRIAANIDLAPTVYEAAGIRPEAALAADGISLLGQQRRQDLLLEYWPELPTRSQYVPWRSLRTRDHQYIEYYERDLETVRFREYYDLVDDPWQLSNLLGDDDLANDPDVSQIRLRMETLRNCVGVECR